MTAVRKFLFDNSFDGDAPRKREKAGAGPALRPVEAEPPAPPPGPTEADVERARNEGLEQGRTEGEAAGRKAAEAETARLTAQMLERIAERLQASESEAAERSAAAQREAIGVAAAIVRKLFPEWVRQHGETEIRALLHACLTELHDEPRLVVRVADPLLDPINESLAAARGKAGFEGKVVLLADDGVAPGDVRIEWADGGAERDSERLWREIDGIIARSLGDEEPASASQTTPDAAPPETAPDTEQQGS